MYQSSVSVAPEELTDVVTTDRVYDFFDTEAEARLAHRLWALAMYGLDRGAKVPFPEDRRQAPRKHPAGGSVFDKVKAVVRLEDFAARFTNLRQAGSGKLKGRCPVHTERTASFVVYVDDQRWRCFGACARGGDVITLGQALMEAGRW